MEELDRHEDDLFTRIISLSEMVVSPLVVSQAVSAHRRGGCSVRQS